MKRLQKNIYVSFLILTLSSSFVVPAFAQEETSKLLLQGATEEDTKTLDNMETFLESVIKGKSDLFPSKTRTIAEEKFDEETIRANIEVEKVLEKRMEAEKEKIELRQKQLELDKNFSKDITYIEKDNIKKFYHVSDSFFEELNSTKNINSLFSNDSFFWYVPCSTASHEYAAVILNEDGISVNTLAYEEKPVFISNEEIKSIIEKQLDKEVMMIKYADIPLIDLCITSVITTEENEYIIPISGEGEEIGIHKGNIYTKEEFVNCMKDYEKPTALVSKTGEIADGTESAVNKTVTEQAMPIAGVLSLLLGISGLFVSKKM